MKHRLRTLSLLLILGCAPLLIAGSGSHYAITGGNFGRSVWSSSASYSLHGVTSLSTGGGISSSASWQLQGGAAAITIGPGYTLYLPGLQR